MGARARPALQQPARRSAFGRAALAHPLERRGSAAPTRRARGKLGRRAGRWLLGGTGQRQSAVSASVSAGPARYSRDGRLANARASRAASGPGQRPHLGRVEAGDRGGKGRKLGPVGAGKWSASAGSSTARSTTARRARRAAAWASQARRRGRACGRSTTSTGHPPAPGPGAARDGRAGADRARSPTDLSRSRGGVRGRVGSDRVRARSRHGQCGRVGRTRSGEGGPHMRVSRKAAKVSAWIEPVTAGPDTTTRSTAPPAAKHGRPNRAPVQPSEAPTEIGGGKLKAKHNERLVGSPATVRSRPVRQKLTPARPLGRSALGTASSGACENRARQGPRAAGSRHGASDQGSGRL